MDLSGLPQFSVHSLEPANAEGDTMIVGAFSHLRGVHNARGWLYRPAALSIIGDLAAVPESADDHVAFVTSDAAVAPELRPGVIYPWLDCYWQPYHLAMILAPAERWVRRRFAASAARYFRQGGIRGWQPVDATLPDGAEDLGVREGAWDHEHCELCRVHIGMAGIPDGYADPDDHWLCLDCHAKYAMPHDVSFAAEA